MHDLDEAVMRQFFRTEEFQSAQQTTLSSGIADLVPGSQIDDFMFSPCGYSMNGLNKEVYWTIHITPEKHCSYVSFETNYNPSSYKALLQQVLDTFRPGRATVTLFGNLPQTSDSQPQKSSSAVEMLAAVSPAYRLTCRTHMDFDGAYELHLLNVGLREGCSPRHKGKLSWD